MKASSLAKLFSIYDLALVDTSSLMEDSFPAFMDVLANSKDYWKDGFKVVLLGDCLDELKKHSQDKDEHLKSIAAKQALKIIKRDQRRTKTFEIRKSLRQDVFADAAIMSVATAEHIHNKVLVITQDKNLTKDLLNLNNLESQRGRWLKVYRLDENGMLIESDGNPSYSPRKNLSVERNYPQSKPIKTFNRNEGERKVNPLLQEITKKDQILAANLGNGNYSDAKKKSDIEKQISLLSKLSYGEKDKLKLSLSEDKLKEALKKYNSSPAKKPEQKTKTSEGEKPVKKPADLKKPAETPAKEKAPKSEVFYYSGPSFSKAFIKLFMSKGWILRDPSVPYFSAIHGPYDITLADLEKVDKLGEGAKAEPSEAELNGLALLLKKDGGSAFIAIAEKKKEEPLPVPEKKAKPQGEGKKPKAPKAEEAKPVEKPIAPIEEEAKKTKAPKAKKTEKKEAPEAKPQKASKKTSKPVEEKPAPVEKQEAPKAKKAADSNASAKAKPAKKPAPKAKVDDPKLIEEIKKADLQLNANIHNPNYPLQRALMDINSQLLRLQPLSIDGKKDLLLSQSELEKRAKELKEKISKN